VFVLYSLSRCELVRSARVGECAVEFETNKEFFVIVCSVLRIHPLVLIFKVVEHRRFTSILSSTTLYTHLIDVLPLHICL